MFFKSKNLLKFKVNKLTLTSLGIFIWIAMIIKTVEKLIDILNFSTKEEYVAVGASLNIDPQSFSKYAYWNDDFYTRNCIARTNDYELILLCWEKNHETPIHCHGGEECWVNVIQGKLKETNYTFEKDILQETRVDILEQGGVSYMNDNMGFHKLENNTDERAMSLHLYMDPIKHCSKYDDKTNSFTPVKMKDYSFGGKLIHENVVV